MDGNLDRFEDEIGIGDQFVMPSPPREASVQNDEVGGGGGNTNPVSEREHFFELYTGEAGKGLRKTKTQYEDWFETQRNEEKIPWFPFASEQEWELTKWLIKNVGQKSTDEFLKLPIVRDVSVLYPYEELTEICQINSKEKLSFYNSYSFLKKVDMLPIGPEWKCSIIEVTGDLLDDDGNTMSEHLELWHRDPVECVKALIGNPAFKEYISYVPERVYIDDEGKVRVFDEMWTGNWWWDTQVWLF